ncbi:hypothetical protein HanPSC8_Chr01g0010691 [Helianthus annuus]|nr:hypothetical protein HanPSC8_Chr01g0010691 [Helianthus annuus]
MKIFTPTAAATAPLPANRRKDSGISRSRVPCIPMPVHPTINPTLLITPREIRPAWTRTGAIFPIHHRIKISMVKTRTPRGRVS